MANFAIFPIRNLSDFERWASDKPIEWSSIIAFRSSLRTLPFIAEFESYHVLSETQRSRIYLATFRSAYFCWASLSYPRSISARAARVAARAGDRLVGHAAGISGAATAAKAAYAVGDAARAITASETKYAIRSIENTIALGQAALTSAPALLWDEIEADSFELASRSQRGDGTGQFVLGRRLWNAGRDISWPRTAFTRFERTLQSHQDIFWEFWLKWYSARSKGTNEYDLTSQWLEEIASRISHEDDRLWDDNYEKLGARILSWVNEALLSPDGKQKTTSEFILDYLKSRGAPSSSKEIVDELSKVRKNVIAKSVRGDLSRLASSGQIVRISPGVYQSSATEGLLIDEIGRVEPQRKGAIQFIAKESTPITVAYRASVGELRADPNTRRRHNEVIDEQTHFYRVTPGQREAEIRHQE
ncbi:MAG: hypothetical protein QM729_13180 [Solirubrobacterales bacterium]